MALRQVTQKPIKWGRAIARTIAVSTIAASTIVAGEISSSAVQLSDGRTYFVQPPRLEKAIATQKSAYAFSATYYFTLSLPENAGEPLQKVVIAQAEGVDEPRYDLRDTQAFEGTEERSGAKLPLKGWTVDRKTRSITVTFDPPVPPGRTITIGLYPIQNPGAGGVYLYGVTAFPPGDRANGNFLGYGRIHIYSNDSF